MTPDRPEPAPDDEARRQSVLGLHALAGGFGDRDPSHVPGFRTTPPRQALRILADATEDQVPISARLQALHGLARAGFPARESSDAEYRALAGSIAAARGMDADQLLSDLQESASEHVAFSSTQTGQSMPHRDVAFLGEQVCFTRSVDVGGLRATWIYSEFETDAPLENVAAWVDPRTWPDRGPLLFKQMKLVGAPDPVRINTLSKQHWHGVFHEEVHLGRPLNTLLHCDYWSQDDNAAGMTYSLDLSLDGEITVDRGFLSVENTGATRHVKALKIVGFSTDLWDEVALLVCPFWTDWVRAAVEGGSRSRPTGGGPPPGAPGPGANLDQWQKFFADSARAYLDVFTDARSRTLSGKYSASDLLGDGTRYWSRLAKDWATAWAFGLEALEAIAERGADAELAPPRQGEGRIRPAAATKAAAAPAPIGSTTTIPLPGPVAAGDLVCTGLVSIEAGGASIAAGAVVVTAAQLSSGGAGVHVGTTDTTVPAGLYVGKLQDRSGNTVAPVQLYVARAEAIGTP